MLISVKDILYTGSSKKSVIFGLKLAWLVTYIV